MLELTSVNWFLKDICIVTSKLLRWQRWLGWQIQFIYEKKIKYLSKLFYAVAESINSTHVIPLQIKLYSHLLRFILHKPLLQSTLLCPIKILLSSPCLKFAVLPFSPLPCQQLGWPQMEHIWQLKWPRCWIWSIFPAAVAGLTSDSSAAGCQAALEQCQAYIPKLWPKRGKCSKSVRPADRKDNKD